ncbi:MAG: metallophosphoesterase [Bacillus sp. (in: firmicutes)]
MWYLLILAGLILFILLVRHMHQFAKIDQVRKHTLTFPNFPPGFGTVSIFFVSDIHRRVVSRELIDEVKHKAELVIIGGDLTDSGVPFSQVENNIRMLKEIGPVYFVWGNNDYEGDYHQLDALLLENGVKILCNTAAIFESEKGDKLSLLGVDYEERADLDLALRDSVEGSFKILAAHTPEMAAELRDEYGISLVLSGHTHGGQIRLFGMGLYKAGGFEWVNHTLLLISNGYGTSALPLRLGVKPETHLIYLSHGKRMKTVKGI